jgi:hypothetical protein
MKSSDIIKTYTNEKLKGLFKSNFELANFAISLAKQHLLNGEYKTLDEIILELTKLAEKKRQS